jgi:hypothetical protein
MPKFVGWIPQWRETEPEPEAAWDKPTAEEAAIEEFSNALSYRNETRSKQAVIWVKDLATGEVTKHRLSYDAASNEIHPTTANKTAPKEP